MCVWKCGFCHDDASAPLAVMRRSPPPGGVDWGTHLYLVAPDVVVEPVVRGEGDRQEGGGDDRADRRYGQGYGRAGHLVDLLGTPGGSGRRRNMAAMGAWIGGVIRGFSSEKSPKGHAKSKQLQLFSLRVSSLSGLFCLLCASLRPWSARTDSSASDSSPDSYS